MTRTTHTFAELLVSQATYNEIAAKLKEAGYDHAFIDGAIDMHGIGLVKVCDDGGIALSQEEATFLRALVQSGVRT